MGITCVYVAKNFGCSLTQQNPSKPKAGRGKDRLAGVQNKNYSNCFGAQQKEGNIWNGLFLCPDKEVI